MIPATLPTSAPAPAPGDPGRTPTAPDDRFDQVLDHATRRSDPAHDRAAETEERSTEPADERCTRGCDVREDVPGADGREQALAAMPADVPARLVLTGTAHDARTAADGDAPAAPGAAADLLAPVGNDVPAGTDAVDDDLPDVPLDAAEVTGSAAAPDAGTPAGDDVIAPAGPEAEIETDTGAEGAGDVRSSDAAPVEDEGTSPRPAASRPAVPSAAPDGEVTDGRGDVPSLRGADPSAGRAADAPGRDVQAARAARPSTPAPDVAAHLDVAAPPAGPSTPAATTSTAAATPAAPPAAPPLAQQLVGQVTPLLAGPDGTHELTIELRPAELGTVRLEVVLDDGVVSVRLHADDPASRRLLAQSLGDLRSALTDAGIDAGSLDVGDPRSGANADEGDGSGERPSAARSDATAPTPDRPSRPMTLSSAAVDVLL